MANDLAIQDNVPKYLKEFDGTELGNQGIGAKQLAVPRLALVQKSSEVEGAKAGEFVDKVSGKNYGSQFTCINLDFKENFIVQNEYNAGGGIHGPFDSQEEANDNSVVSSLRSIPRFIAVKPSTINTSRDNCPYTGENPHNYDEEESIYFTTFGTINKKDKQEW